MDDIAVGDHVSPTGPERDSAVPDGVYRVVGTDEDSVTLLLVGDTDGRRVHTGEVVTVDRGDLDAFESAENPDGNRSPASKIAAQLDAVHMSLWLLARTVRTRPAPGGIAVALLLVGAFGGDRLPLPETALTGLTLAGALLLVYLTRKGPA